MRFETPWAFLLLLFAPLLLEQFGLKSAFSKTKKSASISFSTKVPLDSIHTTWKQHFRTPVLNTLYLLSFFSLVIALARPQSGTSYTEIEASGRDIIIALDTSKSMAALDFTLNGKRSNRLDALKHVVAEFIEQQKGDRMGLVVFGSEVYTQSPLTLDKEILLEFIANLEIGMAGDSTALGDGMAVALKRLKSIEADSKVLVLVTDGMRTAGQMQPIEAARIAEKLGIKVYTVGIGGRKPAPFPAKNIFGVDTVQYRDVPLDEKTLKKIADMTGALYFHASDTDGLARVYQEIAELEKRVETINEHTEYTEQFQSFVLFGFITLLICEILRATVFIKIP